MKYKNMNKKLAVIGILLFVSLMSFASAIQVPQISEPNINDFAYDETRVIFRPLSIFVDRETINLGESATFTIDLSTEIPDSDYSDLDFQWQYAGWAFTDKDGNIIQSKEFERVYGNFSDVVTLKPQKAGEYAFVGLIIQYDQTYDSVTSQWTTSEEITKVKEAKKLNVITPGPPTPQTPGIVSWIGNFFSGIWDWINGLFG